MMHPTDALRYVQQLDREFLRRGYITDIQKVNIHDYSISLTTYISGDIFDNDDRYVDLRIHITPCDTDYEQKAYISDIFLDCYPCDDADTLKDINTKLNDMLVGPLLAQDVAHKVSSACYKLDLQPSTAADLI